MQNSSAIFLLGVCLLIAAGCQSAKSFESVSMRAKGRMEYVGGSQRYFSPIAFGFLTAEQRREIELFYKPDGVIDQNFRPSRYFEITERYGDSLKLRVRSGNIEEIWIMPGYLASIDSKYNETILGLEDAYFGPRKRILP